MSYLLDTNVISEIRKGDRCHPRVSGWWHGVSEDDLHLSTLVIGEIRKGIEHNRTRDPDKTAVFERWLKQVVLAFDGRILTVTVEVAEEWGRMSAIRPLPVADALLAATAKVHELTLVTRNEKHVKDLGIKILNPFETLS